MSAGSVPLPEDRAADRRAVAKIAALTRWSREADRSAATAPARRALLARFEREADPLGHLSPQERARRADALLRAHMLKLSRASAKARARKRGRGAA